MALFDKVTGTIPIPALAGSSYVNVGFQPKAVIVFGTAEQADSLPGGNLIGTFGYSDGINNVCTAFYSQGSTAPSECRAIQYSNKCYASLHSPASNVVAVHQTGTIHSFDATGFTFTRDLNATNKSVYYIAIGGTGVSCQVGTYTASLSAEDIINLGISPDVFMLCSAGLSALATLSPNKHFMFGLTDGGSRFVNTIYRQDNVAANVQRGNRNSISKDIIIVNPATSISELEATCSICSTQVIVSKSIINTTIKHIGYLAINGVETHLGSFLDDEANGAAKAITGVGFTPDSVMFFTDMLDNDGQQAQRNTFVYGFQGGLPSDARTQCWAGNDGGGLVLDSERDSSGYPFFFRMDATDYEQFFIESYDIDGFTIRNVVKNFGWPVTDIFYLAMKAGSNNNSCDPCDNIVCESEFNLFFGEYDYFADSVSDSNLHALNSTCTKLTALTTNNAQVIYDMGGDHASRVDAANCLLIDSLLGWINIDGSVTVRVDAADALTFLQESETFIVTSADLVGLDESIFITKLANFPLQRRYWRVSIISATSLNPLVRHIALGKLVTTDKYPTYESRFRWTGNFAESYRQAISIEFAIESVSVCIKDELFDLLDVTYRNTPMWIFDSAGIFLPDIYCVKCIFRELSAEMTKDPSRFTINFGVEVIE